MEVVELRADREILRTAAANFSPARRCGHPLPPRRRYRDVQDVRWMCALVVVARSSFYAWAAGPSAAAEARKAADATLIVAVEQVWRDSRSPYGWPRVIVQASPWCRTPTCSTPSSMIAPPSASFDQRTGTESRPARLAAFLPNGTTEPTYLRSWPVPHLGERTWTAASRLAGADHCGSGMIGSVCLGALEASGPRTPHGNRRPVITSVTIRT